MCKRKVDATSNVQGCKLKVTRLLALVINVLNEHRQQAQPDRAQNGNFHAHLACKDASLGRCLMVIIAIGTLCVTHG